MEVKVNSLVARQGVAIVELHVDTEQAGPWLQLVGKRVGLALGAVTQEGNPRLHGRAARAVKRSQKREQRALVTEAVEQEKRKRAEEDKKPPPNRQQTDTIRDRLREQMPDGWLLVSDFSAEVCRAVPTVRKWIQRGKIRSRDMRDVPVTGYRRDTVKAVNAQLVEKHRPGRPGRKSTNQGGKSAPIRMLVDRLGVSETAEELGQDDLSVRTFYKEPTAMPEELHNDVVSALSSVLALEQSRGRAREVGDGREDTSQSVPARDEKPMGAAEAAWGEAGS